jgi:hypothetical protein
MTDAEKNVSRFMRNVTKYYWKKLSVSFVQLLWSNVRPSHFPTMRLNIKTKLNSLQLTGPNKCIYGCIVIWHDIV